MPKSEKKTNQKQQAKQKKNWKKYLPAAFIGANIVLVLANISFLALLPSQVKKIITARSEILAYQLQEQSAQKLAVDLQNTNQMHNQIFQSLPNKPRLLEVIKFLESLEEVTQVKSFSFEGDTPIEDNNMFTFLPLSLNLVGSLQQTMTALARLEKAPFLLTVDHTILEIPTEISQTVSLKVFMRLYVSKPFNEN